MWSVIDAKFITLKLEFFEAVHCQAGYFGSSPIAHGGLVRIGNICDRRTQNEFNR